jgi:hypothetical protein
MAGPVATVSAARASGPRRSRRHVRAIAYDPGMATYALIHGAGDGGWFWHLVAAELRGRGQEVAASMARARGQSDTPLERPWPLPAWPEVPTRFLLCRDDRSFPPEFLRRVVRERLGIVPDEIDGGHCVALSRPRELADRLEGYRAAL